MINKWQYIYFTSWFCFYCQYCLAFNVSLYFCSTQSRKRQAGGVIQPSSTRNCVLEQVPNLDYTEPAFELAIAAGDDRSIVTFTYSVGTVPGGTDVVNEEEFNGPSAIIAQVSLLKLILCNSYIFNAIRTVQWM